MTLNDKFPVLQRVYDGESYNYYIIREDINTPEKLKKALNQYYTVPTAEKFMDLFTAGLLEVDGYLYASEGDPFIPSQMTCQTDGGYVISKKMEGDKMTAVVHIPVVMGREGFEDTVVFKKENNQWKIENGGLLDIYFSR